MLIYNGVLTDDELRWVRDHVNDGYKFIVEVRTFPNYEWYSTLKQQKYWRRFDSMGGEHTSECTGTLHATVRLDSYYDEEQKRGGGFILFNNVDDYEKAKTDLADLIINDAPFYSAFSVKKD